MKSALKITLIYFIIGFLWILFSDHLLENLAANPKALNELQTYKGWFFVICTSFFLYVLISREIQKETKLNEELLKAKKKAEESDQLKAAFLSNMSHEIRTPLNGIVGFSQLLFESDGEIEIRQMYIDQVNKNSEMLLKIINNILEISKIQEDMIVTNFREVAICELLKNIQQTYGLVKSALVEKGLQFTVETYEVGEKIKLMTDPDHLYQILYNLIDNAVKYTAQGKITLGCQLEDAHVRIYVKDTGIGISDEIMPLIFDRFKPFQKGGEFSDGFGLGLSICQGLANALRAKMEVSSQPGKGSCFSVLLPLEPEMVKKEPPAPDT